MADHVARTTQQQFPWRATIRTVLEWVLGLAAVTPLLYQAIMDQDPAAATGWGVTAIAIAGAVTRVAQVPWVDHKLSLIGLGSAPRAELEK